MAKSLTYTPEIFEQKTVDDAKKIILTVPPDIADEYWTRSTVATVDLMVEAMRPTPDDVLVDFGCGIGRMAKEMIARTGCRIVGVDISAQMRRLAVDYVASDRFSVMSSEELFERASKYERLFSAAYSIIVLQHVLEPEFEMRCIRATCKPGSPFFVYNCSTRCVPSNKGWTNDGKDVGKLAAELFDFEREIDVPRAMLFYPEKGPFPGEIEGHWFRLYRTKPV